MLTRCSVNGFDRNRRRSHAERPQNRPDLKAMQASSQISEPDYGALLDDMFFHDGSDIRLIALSCRALKWSWLSCWQNRCAGQNCTLFDVYNATDVIRAGLIHARCHNIDPGNPAPAKVFDTISDNAANAGSDPRWSSDQTRRTGSVLDSRLDASAMA